MQRTRKETTRQTTLYHYDRNGNLIAETIDGTSKRAYVWADTEPLAQIDTVLKSGKPIPSRVPREKLPARATRERLTFLHPDHLQTPRLGTNAEGTKVWGWEGEAFGDSVPNEDPDKDRVATTINLRYAGQYYDDESGLFYNWHRYYDPRTGRYLTSDPIGLWGGLNTYAYVSGNPLRFMDPLGLFCIPLWDETTPWEETWRGKTYYELTGVIFSDLMRTAGSCLWVKTFNVEEKRKVRDRQLCWECNDQACGFSGCGFVIKYGDWEEEKRYRTRTEHRPSPAHRIFSGNDIAAGDLWWCNNPWTGQRASGRMR